MPPLATVSCTDAAVRIDPSVGPTHGVHANAKAAPAISGPPEPAREINASGRHSRLSLGTNGVRRKNTPSAMITAPATLSSVPRESRRVEPRLVAVIPSATKTAVNDRQNTIAGRSRRPSERSPARISAIDTPETADR